MNTDTLVELEAFFPDIEPELPRCPVPVIENRIRDTIIDACERANLWRWEHPEILVQSGVQDYDLLTPTSDTLVHSLLRVRLNGQPLSGNDGVAGHDDHFNLGSGFSIADRGQLHLHRVPTLASSPLRSLVAPTVPALPILTATDPGVPNPDPTVPLPYMSFPLALSNKQNFTSQGNCYTMHVNTQEEADLFLARPYATGPNSPGNIGQLMTSTIGFEDDTFNNVFEFVIPDPHPDWPSNQEVLIYRDLQFATDTGSGISVGSLKDTDQVTTMKHTDPRMVPGSRLRFAQFPNTGPSDSKFVLIGFDLSLVSQESVEQYETAVAQYNADVVTYQDATDALRVWESLAVRTRTGIEPVVSIKPSRTTLEVAGVLHRDYYALIRYGTLARAMLMVNRPWTNPEVGKEMEKQYEYALAKAKQGIDRGFHTGTQRIKPRRFG